MTPIQLERYAAVMVWALHRARLNGGPQAVYKPGDIVILQYDPAAGQLAEGVYRLLIKERLQVVLRPQPHFAMEPILVDNADETQLGFLGSWEKDLFSQANGLIMLRAPESLTHMKDCDPSKNRLKAKAIVPIREIRNGRQNQGLFSWTLCMVPTQALADQAQMSLDEYTQQVVKACYLDDDDPIGRWTSYMAQSDLIMNWLTAMPIDHVHVQSDDGETDLKVWIGEQRRWMGGSGFNIPSFEIFTSPARGRVEGRYHASEPSFRDGRYVRDVRLVFEGGAVVKATASAEQDFLREMVAMDEGAKFLGEFSLTDKRFSEITAFMSSTLFDENVGGEHGNCHIAIGNSYEDTYSGDLAALTPERSAELLFNKSALHWDLVTTSPRTVTAHLKDGSQVVIYRDGMFTLPL